MIDLQLFDLASIPVDPFHAIRAILARLTDAQLYELNNFALDAAFADEDLVEFAAAADIQIDPLPDDITMAIHAHYQPLLDAIEAEREKRIELRFHCLDCQVHTGDIGQYPYNCPDELWYAVVPDGQGMLCLACLATRLDAAGLPWPWRWSAGQMAGQMAEGTTGIRENTIGHTKWPRCSRREQTP